MFNYIMQHIMVDMRIKAIQTYVQLPAVIVAPKYPFFRPISGRVYLQSENIFTSQSHSCV
jgi:hypothetical protein